MVGHLHFRLEYAWRLRAKSIVDNVASSLLLCCCYALYMRYWEVIDRFITTPGFQNNDAQVA